MNVQPRQGTRESRRSGNANDNWNADKNPANDRKDCVDQENPLGIWQGEIGFADG